MNIGILIFFFGGGRGREVHKNNKEFSLRSMKSNYFNCTLILLNYLKPNKIDTCYDQTKDVICILTIFIICFKMQEKGQKNFTRNKF